MKAVSRTILLAEDNEDDAFLTMRAMETAGIILPIHHCRDGQAVIDSLKDTLTQLESGADVALPELVLLDLKMPRVDGLETLKWIREHPTLKSLVVLALTSSNEQRDVRSAYDLHINAYLVKPSSLSEMIELARAVRLFWLDQNHFIKPRLGFPSAGRLAPL